MGDAIDDELLHLIAVVGEPASVASALAERWGDVYDRLSLYAPYAADPALLAEVAGAVRREVAG
jgi:hypothetical protein